MNSRITRLGIGLIVLYSLLFLQLNRVQVLDADRLNNHPENFRSIQRDFDRPRGLISSADGTVLARSIDTPDAAFERRREYPEGELFAHTVGHLSLEFGATGAEEQFNDHLAGTTSAQQFDRVSDLFVDRDRTGDVTLSLRRDLQAAARAALGERRGSVVLLDPVTGAVLTLWSWPSYDPNQLSNTDLAAAKEARELLLATETNPLLGKSFQERFFPGSGFKVVTAGVGLEVGVVTESSPDYEISSGFVPPAATRPIGNFGGGSCGGTLFRILAESCNSAFAEMGAVTIGPPDMIDGVDDFGFNETPPLDLAGAAVSTFPTDYGALISGPGGANSVYENSAALAQASIGQNDVQASPLMMALVAAGVANGGEIMAPTVLSEIRDREGEVLKSTVPNVWRTPLSRASAALLRGAMVGVVTDGSARGLAIDGYVVGAKTGTAQVAAVEGARGAEATHAWVIGFAGVEGSAPAVAFAVLVEADPALGQQTGGGVSVPIAREVLSAALPALVGSR